jgi:hypothetical protein
MKGWDKGKRSIKECAGESKPNMHAFSFNSHYNEACTEETLHSCITVAIEMCFNMIEMNRSSYSVRYKVNDEKSSSSSAESSLNFIFLAYIINVIFNIIVKL